MLLSSTITADKLGDDNQSHAADERPHPSRAWGVGTSEPLALPSCYVLHRNNVSVTDIATLSHSRSRPVASPSSTARRRISATSSSSTQAANTPPSSRMSSAVVRAPRRLYLGGGASYRYGGRTTCGFAMGGVYTCSFFPLFPGIFTRG